MPYREAASSTRFLVLTADAPVDFRDLNKPPHAAPGRETVPRKNAGRHQRIDPASHKRSAAGERVHFGTRHPRGATIQYLADDRHGRAIRLDGGEYDRVIR